MQCLVGYALCPSFSNLAFAVAIKLSREKIAQLEYSVNEQLDITAKHNVDFNMGKTPETIHCKELQDLLSMLEEEIRAKNKPKASEKINQGNKGKGKKLISQKMHC